MKPRVGFIGLGAMGKPMATNLLRKGFQVRVFDLAFQEEQMQYWSDQGAETANSAKEVAESAQAIITMLPKSENVEAAVLGDSGVIEGIIEGSTVIDMSTIDPITSKRVAKALAVKKVEMLDAPVARSVKAAEEGTLAIFVGGKKEILEKYRGILESMGTDIFHTGGLGTGEVVKIVNNLIVAGTMSLLSEALVLGVKAGVSADILFNCLGAGSANSFVLQHHVREAVMKGEFKEGVFPVSYMLKDLDLALRTAASYNVPMYFTALSTQFYQQSICRGDKDRYHPIVIRSLEDLSGVEVRSNE